jgi:radical SAM superfamily enzyme YgiQ (UPF0313 family)
LLVKPPYFTPWTPPLGISILKSYLEQHQYSVRCFDFNTDPELWGMHHKYFGMIQTLEDVSINDGYSKLWWILNSHMLAYANGADADACARVLEVVIPLYGIKRDDGVIKALLPFVERFFQRLGESIAELDLSDYSVVGTSTYSTSLGPSLFLLKKLKQKYPHITAVMGGGIFADDLALGSDNLDTLIEQYPYIDHVVLGEGELLFLKLLRGELAHKRVISLADLKGTTLQMADVPSPDFSDMNLDNYYHLTIEGARSCPFQCSFCSETIQWGDYRKKPMDLFAQQVIELAEKNGNNSFFMGDSLMNPYILQFANEMLERRAGILYDGYLRADKPVTHRDRVMTWAESGLYRVRLGIESASARVLDSMDKMTTPKVISDALKTLANAGIRTTTYWIVGFPGETEDEFEETLEFIRENHRFIYELEAHPYYYYPYGQIGSRLYQCRSLYPNAVTDIIKFKVWDIIDCKPARDERYERLRRVSELSSSLGLPNIYTMADRYKAEDRWLLLHPLTAEVYAGSRLMREEAPLPARAVEIYANGWASRAGGEREAGDVWGAVVCHKLSVKKELDENILSASVRELVRSNQALQLDVRGGEYVAGEDGGGEPLSVYDAGEDSTEASEEAERAIAARLASGMQPARGSSLRVALIRRGASSRHLLLLAHKAVADGRSVALLCEDLFRIYEQLAHGKQVSLRPLGRAFTAFVGELTAEGPDAESGPEESAAGTPPHAGAGVATAGAEDGGASATASVALDRLLMKRLTSETLFDYGTTPQVVMLSALLRCCAKAAGGRPPGVDLLIDNRSIEEGLEFTVGPLTRPYRLSPTAVESAGDVRAVDRDLRELLGDAGRKLRLPYAGDERGRILLNLEYFMNTPWLGGDEWSSEGFVVDEESLTGGYLVEVVPHTRGDEARAVFKYRDTPEEAEFAARASGLLPQELSTVLKECEDYVGARRYWAREFGKSVPKPHLEPVNDDSVAGEYFSEIDFTLGGDVLRGLKAACEADASSVTLAAYAVLLFLLSGREEAVVVSADEGGGGDAPALVRLYPSADMSFGELVRQAVRKSAFASAHGAHVFDVVARELPRAEDGVAGPVFDAGFVFGGPANDREAVVRIEWVLERYGVGGSALSLVLQAAESAEGLRLRLTCRRRLFGHEGVEKLASYLQRILEQAAADPGILLRDITPDEASAHTVSEVLAGETFNFS